MDLSPRAVLEALGAAGRDPWRESCGLLLGVAGRILRAWEIRNAAALPTRFALDPLAQLRVERAARRAGFGIAGYFHSHISGNVRPSDADLGPWDDLAPVWRLICAPGGDWALYDASREWALRRRGWIRPPAAPDAP
jgi:proteasome lid subunit RPN8/RPN11